MKLFAHLHFERTNQPTKKQKGFAVVSTFTARYSNVLKKRCLPKFEKFHKTILYNGFALPVPPID